jgi:hypothetical protein
MFFCVERTIMIRLYQENQATTEKLLVLLVVL